MVCGGDFNRILYLYEKRGMRDRNASQRTRFIEALEDAGMHDLGYQESDFTWYNRRKGTTAVWSSLWSMRNGRFSFQELKYTMDNQLSQTTVHLWCY